MSIEITITQKGILKKMLPFGSIRGDLAFGAFDGLRLNPGVVGEEDFILYNPQQIGRGIQVFWKGGEKEKVVLRLPMPTTAREIDDYYDTVERIVKDWRNSTIDQDGEIITRKDIPEKRTAMKEHSLWVLRTMCHDNNGGPLTISCALWQIALAPDKEMAAFADAQNLDDFTGYLHTMQSIDAYYAKPNFYKTEAGYFGLYTLVSDTVAIFPLKPYVPFFAVDKDTGERPVVNRWYISLGDATNLSLGQIPYADFIGHVDIRTQYDALHVLLDGQPSAKLQALVNQYRVEIQ